MFEIVLEHPAFTIVNKLEPASFHCEDGQTGFFEAVKRELGGECYPVHRLDIMTTGLVVVARTQDAARELGDLFANRQVNKCYLAISNQKPKKKQGLVKGDMAKARRGSWKLLRTTENPAITRFDSVSLEPGVRLYKVRPQTGKTHQIRVALKSIGAPILGDVRYGGGEADRGYLHAYALQFDYDGEPICIAAAPSNGQYFLSEACQAQLAAYQQDSTLIFNRE